MASTLSGQVALITGASSGIGEALARELAQRNVRLVLTARRLDRIEALAREIRGGGGLAIAVGCDVTRDGDVEDAVQAAREAFGGIDIVVANAGFGVNGNMDTLSLSDYRRQFETNVFGLLRTAFATLPDLKRSHGRLAFIGSSLGYLSLPGMSAYCMSKAAVRALADSLRAELHGDGVSVTHIGPGVVESDIRRVDNQGVFKAERRESAPSWIMMPAREAAREIADAIAARKDEAILSRHGQIGVTLSRRAPRLTSAMMGALATGMRRKRQSPEG